MSDMNFYTVGGTIPIEGKIYIRRQADEELLALCRAGSLAYVLSTRQVGKSSLMVRTARQLEAEGTRCASVDLSLLGTEFEGAEWYLGLLSLIDEHLELSTDIEGWWEDHANLSGTQRLVTFFQKVIIEEIAAPIVIFLDEIDSTLSLPFTSDFFVAIRALYNARAQVPALRRLTFVLIGVATPSDLISDSKRTPFNIGQRVELTDFTLVEAAPLAEGFALPAEQAEQLLACSLKWTGGHPYLTQRLCVALLGEPKSLTQGLSRGTRESQVDQVVASCFFGEKARQDSNLRFVRGMLTERAPDKIAVLSTYRDIRRGRPIRYDPQSLTQSHLKLSGIVYPEGNKLQVRNRIYEEVFDQKWIKEQWPLNWWQSLPRSIKIASGMMAVMFVMLLLSLGFAVKQQQLASLRANSEAIARADAEEAAGKEKDARADAERESVIARSQAKASEALLELSHDNLERALLLTRASVSYDTANYPIVVSRALRQSEEETKWLSEVLHHPDSVNSAEWSPDGQQLLTSGLDSQVQIWDTTTGELFLSLDDKVTSASWSPDGQQVLTVGLDERIQIQIWDATTGQSLQSFTIDTDRSLEFVTLSPDGSAMLTGSYDGSVQIWSKTGELLHTLVEPSNGSFYRSLVTWSPDGSAVLTSSDDGGVQIWSKTGELLHTFDFFAAHPVTWHPDGQQVAIAHWDGVQIREVTSGELLTTFPELESSPSSIAWSPDGHRLLIGTEDGTVQIWSQEGQLLRTFVAHTSPVRQVAWHPDGGRLLTRGERYESTVRIWDVTDLLGKSFSVWSPDRQQLLMASEDDQIQIWRPATDERLDLFSTPPQGSVDEIRRVEWSPNSEQVLTINQDDRAQIWMSSTGDLIDEILLDFESKSIMGWGTSDHNSLSHRNDMFWIWDLVTGKQLPPIKFSGQFPQVWILDGQQVLTESSDRQAQIWDMTTGQLLHTLGDQGMDFIDLSPDRQKVFTTVWNTPAQIWDVSTGQLLHTLSKPSDFIWNVWSPDGQQIITVNDNLDPNNMILFIWDAATGQLLHTLKERSVEVGWVAWSPKGQQIVTKSDDNTARIRNTVTGELLHTLEGHSDSVKGVAWSPDGQKVATGSEDKTARIWDATTGDLLNTLVLEGDSDDSTTFVSWSADGQRVSTGYSDWIVDESILIARLTEVVCMVWAHDEEAIRAEVPNWRGCEVELAGVADGLAKYKALRAGE